MINFFNFLYCFIQHYLKVEFYNFGILVLFDNTFEENLEIALKLNNINYSKQNNLIRVNLGECELILPKNEKGLREIYNMEYVYKYLGLNSLCQGQILNYEIAIPQYNFYSYPIPVLFGVITPLLEGKIPYSQQEIMKFYQDLSFIVNNFIVFPLNMENILYSPTYDRYIVFDMENIDIKPSYIECNLDNLFNNTSCYSYLGNNITNFKEIMILKQGEF